MNVLTFSKTIARITLLEAIRSRVAGVAVVAIGIALATAAFLSQVAMIEVREIQVSIMAGLLRVSGVFLVAAFCITSVHREINDKVMELYLSRASSRSDYYLGKFAGCTAVALIVALAFGVALLPFAPVISVITWSLSLGCEVLIVAAVSLFCAISISQFTPAFAATAGFYALARSISAMQVIATAPVSVADTWTDTFLKWIVDAIALFMPALDKMTQTVWLVDAPPELSQLTSIAVQAVLYLLLIGTASLVDLHRKSL
jgi:Cu-processing system permease protein